jgi:adenine-specific DNA-methyltransferase
MIVRDDAIEFVRSLDDDSVDLFLFDPPYYGIVDDAWDNQWKTPKEYVVWLARLFGEMDRKIRPHGSIVFFQGIGKHAVHPVFDVVREAERVWNFRNWITWKKRRAYGKKDDYLFCREEILWFSAGDDLTFNIPLLDEKRGYAGFSKKYPAKSEFKRVSNVWDDIPELMRPERRCQKPVPLIERLVLTHSNAGDTVVDPFVGWGTTAVACARVKRRFVGCDVDGQTVIEAVRREQEAIDAVNTIEASVRECAGDQTGGGVL